jgi:hypothetical protein
MFKEEIVCMKDFLSFPEGVLVAAVHIFCYVLTLSSPSDSSTRKL